MPTGVSVCYTQSKTPTSATTTSAASTDKDMHWYVLRVTYGRAIKAELQIVDEFVKGDDSTYVVRKQRKTCYMLQKYYLVATYCDEEKGEWHMLMPKELRESLSESLPFFLELAMKGVQ